MMNRLLKNTLKATAATSRANAPYQRISSLYASSSVRSISHSPSRQANPTNTPASSSSFDPQEASAQKELDEGTAQLEQGDLAAAEASYQRSLVIKDTAIGHYNLGVVQYQLQDLPKAIESFKRSLELAPVSTSTAETPAFYPPTPAQIVLADTHQNLGAAYILSTPPRPDLALSHLQEALELMPDDGEVCFNLGAVLEATGEIEEALVAYRRARTLGIERASVNERNIGAKLLGKRRAEEEAEDLQKLKDEAAAAVAANAAADGTKPSS